MPGSYAYIPVVAGGTAFIYNLKIGGKPVTNLRLSGETVAKIFTGVITQWNDPAIQSDNPGIVMPACQVFPVVRSDGSGSSAQFTKWMIAMHPAIWNDFCERAGRAPKCGFTSNYPTYQGMIGASGDPGIVTSVVGPQSEGAIGYVNYSYAIGNSAPVAKVLNAAGFYTEPTPENVAVSLLKAQINRDETNPATYLTQVLDGVYTDTDPRSYQLSSYSYFILPTTLLGNFNEDKGYTLSVFANYAMCQAQQNSAALGYSPMPISLVEPALEQIRKIPGAVTDDIDVSKCDNPTFDPANPNDPNRLATIAPQPQQCDQQGALQCPDGTGGMSDVPTAVSAVVIIPSGNGGNDASGNTGGSASGGITDDEAADDSGASAGSAAGQGAGTSASGRTGTGASASTGSAATGSTGSTTASGAVDGAADGTPGVGGGVVGGGADGEVACDPDTGECVASSAGVGGGAVDPVTGQVVAADTATVGAVLPTSLDGGPDAGQAVLVVLVGLLVLALVLGPAYVVALLHRGARTVSRLVRWALAALGVAMPIVVLTSAGPATSAPLAGSQGTDTALPATDSAVTVRGRGNFSSLEIDVNQTRNLANQAVSITWSGAAPTRRGPADFAANYLQIFQCWGDDDGTVPDNPGPPPEQCVQGAVAGSPSNSVGNIVPPGSYTFERIIRPPSWTASDPHVGAIDPVDGTEWRPFRSVDGRTVDFQINSRFVPGFAGNYWLNPFFDIVTTNEIGVAPTAPDGTGAALLEVNTGVESSGLGCGQRRQPLPDGGTRIPQCWIVIVPRGEPIDENVNTSPNNEGEFADLRGVLTSPLSPQAWHNRIAVPIDFNPVDTPCDINADVRRISGTELAIPAVVSWQPALCGGGDLPPYTFAKAADSTARLQLTRGTAGMVVVSRPLVQPSDPQKQVVYAPLTASGLVIGFNIERTPAPEAPDDALALAGVRVAELNLTPRLVAKLLTNSYANQVNILFQPSGLGWVDGNPRHPYEDPDFVQFNPEFAQLQMFQGRTLSGLNLPAGNSDTARQLWQWVLSDPEAKAWLDGGPDEWGMVVNPAYAVVTSGTPESFPKADPYCYQPPDVTNVPEPYTPPKLCTVDWMPPATGFSNAAANTRRAYDGARIGEDLANPPLNATGYWKRSTPQKIGQKGFLSVTDTASAAQFGIQMARLSRAGDDGPDRTFIAPSTASLTAGVNAMRPGAEPSLLEPVPLEQPADAYPLTTLTYAAIQPFTLDQVARSEYGAFIEYRGDERTARRRPARRAPSRLRAVAACAARAGDGGCVHRPVRDAGSCDHHHHDHRRAHHDDHRAAPRRRRRRRRVAPAPRVLARVRRAQRPARPRPGRRVRARGRRRPRPPARPRPPRRRRRRRRPRPRPPSRRRCHRPPTPRRPPSRPGRRRRPPPANPASRRRRRSARCGSPPQGSPASRSSGRSSCSRSRRCRVGGAQGQVDGGGLDGDDPSDVGREVVT